MMRHLYNWSCVYDGVLRAETKQEVEYTLDGTPHGSICNCASCNTLQRWYKRNGLERFFLKWLWFHLCDKAY